MCNEYQQEVQFQQYLYMLIGPQWTEAPAEEYLALRVEFYNERGWSA